MRLRRVLSLHLSSSSLFALGTALPVISYSIAYYTQNTVSELLVEMFSWTLLACHVLPEMVVDLNTFPKAKRKLPHMRYGTGPCTNFLQSVVFAASCIFSGIFFANTWSNEKYSTRTEEDMEAYKLLNLVAGNLWLLSGLLSTCSVGSAFPFCRKSDDHAGFWERIANDLYFVTTITLCVAGYVMLAHRSPAHIMHIIARGAWCAIGVFYIMNDLVEDYLYKGSVTEEARKRQKTLLSEDDVESGRTSKSPKKNRYEQQAESSRTSRSSRSVSRSPTRSPSKSPRKSRP